MACRSAVNAPKRRTCGGKMVGALGAGRDATALGGTQIHHSVAPTSMPAACGLSVWSKAAAAGSGAAEGGVRRDMATSSMTRLSTRAHTRAIGASRDEDGHCARATAREHTVAVGGGVAGGGSLPNGIDPGGRRPPGRHQRRGRRLPKPGSYTGTRYHSAIGYRDSLPGVKITYLRPCSPPSACPVRGVKGSYGTQRQINRPVEEAIVASTREETARLAQGMPPQEITVTQDETFTGGLCLGRD